MSIVLGIESTAHTFGVGIVKNGKVLSNIKKTYTTETGGIIPVEAAKHHFQNKNEIYFESLDEAGITEDEIDAISFSQGPGLAPCLMEGMKFAKELSLRLKKPLIPVNHCIAHLEIGKITGAKDPVMLYVSGANTQIIAYSSGKYRIFGETLDLGTGNFIDTFARFLGIGFPGGPKIQQLASEGKNYIELPYVVKGMDISLSGILTNLKQKIDSKKYNKEDLCYSMQETVFAMLVETAERALAHTGKSELLLGGGVACNSRLQEMCKIMCKERGAKLFVPDNSLLVDNGAMIAFLGEIMFKSTTSPTTTPKKDKSKIIYSPKKINKLDIKPRQRTDEVEVSWR
jgi:N6-L-threonylcarbamoyladenine synthase